jgi:hypothetical protein
MRLYLFAALALTACATAPARPDGKEAVTLGSWCAEVGAMHCNALAKRCFSGQTTVAAGCQQTFTPTCLGGRESGTATGRTYDDLRRCFAFIESLSCEGLGAATGSGAMREHCGVATPAPAAPEPAPAAAPSTAAPSTTAPAPSQ